MHWNLEIDNIKTRKVCRLYVWVPEVREIIQNLSSFLDLVVYHTLAIYSINFQRVFQHLRAINNFLLVLQQKVKLSLSLIIWCSKLWSVRYNSDWYEWGNCFYFLITYVTFISLFKVLLKQIWKSTNTFIFT